MGETDGQRQTSEIGSVNPFPALATLPGQLRNDSVRDLAWTLLSPALMRHCAGAQRHPLTASAWADAPQALEDWLRQLDQAPESLDAWLAQRGSRRLGLYYERLWHFALIAAPGIELLASNLPIRAAGRTLGELDVLLRDRTGLHHLELAIKLYLGPERDAGEQAEHWLGPGCHDRLGSKLAHLANHQLPMAAHPETRIALAALGIDTPQSHLWLGGYLFYPWSEGCRPPAGAAVDHLRGHWVRQSDWAGFVASRPAGHWQPLPRERWLAPARVEHERVWSVAQFEQWRALLEPQATARLLVRLAPETDSICTERERVFLVSDQWPAPAFVNAGGATNAAS